MNHKRLLSALAKVGATITNPHADNGKEPRYFVATGKNGNKVCWYVQKKWDDETVLEAVSVHTPSPHTDAMRDCFCDTFYHTIKAAAGSLK